MAKIPFQVGPLLFPTKNAAKEHFRAILYRHAIGGRIPEPDVSELNWLLERHPEADQKIGTGIDHFSVRPALYGTRCFEAVRTDEWQSTVSPHRGLDGV